MASRCLDVHVTHRGNEPPWINRPPCTETPSLQLHRCPCILALRDLTDKPVLTRLVPVTGMLTLITSLSGLCLKLTAGSSCLKCPPPTEGTLSSRTREMSFSGPEPTRRWKIHPHHHENYSKHSGSPRYLAIPPTIQSWHTHHITGQPSPRPTSYTHVYEQKCF